MNSEFDPELEMSIVIDCARIDELRSYQNLRGGHIVETCLALEGLLSATGFSREESIEPVMALYDKLQTMDDETVRQVSQKLGAQVLKVSDHDQPDQPATLTEDMKIGEPLFTINIPRSINTKSEPARALTEQEKKQLRGEKFIDSYCDKLLSSMDDIVLPDDVSKRDLIVALTDYYVQLPKRSPREARIRHREVIMRLMDGQKFSEISEEMNVKEVTLRSWAKSICDRYNDPIAEEGMRKILSSFENNTYDPADFVIEELPSKERKNTQSPVSHFARKFIKQLEIGGGLKLNNDDQVTRFVGVVMDFYSAVQKINNPDLSEDIITTDHNMVIELSRGVSVAKVGSKNSIPTSSVRRRIEPIIEILKNDHSDQLIVLAQDFISGIYDPADLESLVRGSVSEKQASHRYYRVLDNVADILKYEDEAKQEMLSYMNLDASEPAEVNCRSFISALRLARAKAQASNRISELTQSQRKILDLLAGDAQNQGRMRPLEIADTMTDDLSSVDFKIALGEVLKKVFN